MSQWVVWHIQQDGVPWFPTWSSFWVHIKYHRKSNPMLSWVPDLNNLIQETCGCLLIEWTISNNTSTLLEFGRKRWRRYQDSVRPNFVYFEKCITGNNKLSFYFLNELCITYLSWIRKKTRLMMEEQASRCCETTSTEYSSQRCKRISSGTKTCRWKTKISSDSLMYSVFWGDAF